MEKLVYNQKQLRKKNTYESVYALHDDREVFPNASKSGIFPFK